MTAFKRSQANYVKGTYKITNWPQYEAGLRQRGSLTVWISEEDELKGWRRPMRGQRKPGGQFQYSNHVIEIALTVGKVFHLRLRQTEGFFRSLFSLLVLDGRAPDHTTISRRAKKLGKCVRCFSRARADQGNRKAARVGAGRWRLRQRRRLQGRGEPYERTFAEGAHFTEKEREGETGNVNDKGEESEHTIASQIGKETAAHQVRIQPTQLG